MFHRRVVRGSTYAQPVDTPGAREEMVRRKKAAAESRRQEASARRHGERLLTPDAVDGRKHMDVQTENYLEEVTDSVAQADGETQTDPFLDRPPSPMFVPHKTGVDAETQVEEGELFDFDFEVEPILDVIAGKTLEQALMEVLEEEELANLRHHQDEFDRIRNAELAETQRMEAAEKRRYEEKQRRLEQERGRLEAEKTVADKVAARTFAKSYVGELVGEVFDDLVESGHFYDPLEKEVSDDFMPWLLDQVGAELDTVRTAKSLVDNVIQRAIELRAEQVSEVREARAAEEAAVVVAAEAEAAVAAEAEAAEAAAAAEGDAAEPEAE